MATTEHNGTTTREKDYGNEHLNSNMDTNEALNRIKTAGSISISPELFEKIYLSPQNQVKGDLRKTFGNPTPLALMGFIISLAPLSCDLMGWRGTNGPTVGAAGIGTYYFFGGLLMIIGSVGEFIIGNTFPFVVFGGYGAFWLSFAATLQPSFNAFGAYATNPANPGTGLETAAFHSSIAFFLLAMGFLSFLYLILSLRTNIVFFVLFLTLVFAFSFIAGAYWQVANGNLALASKLQTGGGACLFVTCACGFWVWFAIMLAALDFPFQLPVGDLSTLIKPGSAKMQGESNV